MSQKSLYSIIVMGLYSKYSRALTWDSLCQARWMSQKSLYNIVSLISKYGKELIFENLCQARWMWTLLKLLMPQEKNHSEKYSLQCLDVTKTASTLTFENSHRRKIRKAAHFTSPHQDYSQYRQYVGWSPTGGDPRLPRGGFVLASRRPCWR
jgi:hypothetical protein